MVVQDQSQCLSRQAVTLTSRTYDALTPTPKMFLHWLTVHILTSLAGCPEVLSPWPGLTLSKYPKDPKHGSSEVLNISSLMPRGMSRSNAMVLIHNVQNAPGTEV